MVKLNNHTLTAIFQDVITDLKGKPIQYTGVGRQLQTGGMKVIAESISRGGMDADMTILLLASFFGGYVAEFPPQDRIAQIRVFIDTINHELTQVP